MSERSNIRDVAARAGVAVKTVSRVLNGDGPVGEKTKAAVEAAMRDLGYVRSNAARMIDSEIGVPAAIGTGTVCVCPR